ncbi:MAG TPA: hypothetical protein VN285_09240 [Candidatus Deferrimicrobium sp.]|nr:hypothetical protein [Candidatus Deferrimicrobium sp.]
MSPRMPSLVNCYMRYWSISIAASILLAVPADGAPLKGQAVTWADFNFVNSVTASLSHVYFATTHGIIRYNKLEERWEEPLTGAAGLDDVNVLAVEVNMFDKKLYARTSTSLVEYDALLDKWFPISEVPATDNDIVHLKPPTLMHPPIGFTYGDGGRLIDRVNRPFPISDVVDDRSGYVWIGTWGLGPAQARSATYLVNLLSYGLLQSRVSALFLRDSRVWIAGSAQGSLRSGISVFDPAKNAFTYFESGLGSDLPAVDVNCLAADDSSVCVGTPSGVFVIDRDSQWLKWRLSGLLGLEDDNVTSLQIMGESLFVGTTQGLNLVTGDGDAVTSIRPGMFRGHTIYDLEAADSALWIASTVGAYRLKLPSGRLQQFEDSGAVLFGDVYGVASHGNNLWFVSDYGLVRLNAASGESEPFRWGAAKIIPRSLTVNDTIAAVATNKGVWVVFHQNPARTWREFTTEDGLVSNNTFAVALDGDYLWIGTDQGLTRFLWNNPARID